MSRARLLCRGLDSGYLRMFLRPETTWIMRGNASQSPSPYSGLICLLSTSLCCGAFCWKMTFWSEAKHGGDNTKRSRWNPGSRHKSHGGEGSDQGCNQHYHHHHWHQHDKSLMSSNLYNRFNPFFKINSQASTRWKPQNCHCGVIYTLGTICI